MIQKSAPYWIIGKSNRVQFRILSAIQNGFVVKDCNWLQIHKYFLQKSAGDMIHGSVG